VPEAPTFDLQAHSTFSDGALLPQEVVARAAAAGVETLALTDHDTVGGVDAALAAGRRHGIRVVPAVELSSVDGVYEDLHVLGYLLDHRDPALLAALDDFRADREARAGRMAAALREAGLALEEETLAARRAGGLPIGRPHLAAAALAHPANAARLRYEGIDDVGPFIEAYLVAGKPTFRPRTTPSVAEAIDVVHAAGGLAVWAHPFWDLAGEEDVRAAIARFAGFGVDGVEAFYVTHDREQALAVVEECSRRGLLTTGSSDFHGPEHRRFSRFRAFDLHGLEPALGPLGGRRPAQHER
jgi:predicted metal-dependent phosphoesterase TrpH